MEISIVREAELRQCVELDEAVIQAIEDAFTDLALGKATVPPIIGIEIPGRRGELDVKAAHIEGLSSFAVKIASGFFDNELEGLPVSSGMMVVISTHTGFPQAILLDNGYLTQVRTGAAGAVAAKYLAREDVDTVAIVGAGMQGRFQARALALVREFSRLLIFDLNARKAQQYADEMAVELGKSVEVASDLEAVIRASDIVVTATPSREPYLKAEWLHPGMHITAMGADMAEKQELHTEVITRADILACDLKNQSLVRGELHHALERGLPLDQPAILELGELTSQSRSGRLDDRQVSVCDLTGVGIQDTAIARLAVSRASSLGFGLTVDA
jgi:ectoine utilization protein EutC